MWYSTSHHFLTILHSSVEYRYAGSTPDFPNRKMTNLLPTLHPTNDPHICLINKFVWLILFRFWKMYWRQAYLKRSQISTMAFFCENSSKYASDTNRKILQKSPNFVLLLQHTNLGQNVSLDLRNLGLLPVFCKTLSRNTSCFLNSRSYFSSLMLNKLIIFTQKPFNIYLNCNTILTIEDYAIHFIFEFQLECTS